MLFLTEARLSLSASSKSLFPREREWEYRQTQIQPGKEGKAAGGGRQEQILSSLINTPTGRHIIICCYRWNHMLRDTPLWRRTETSDDVRWRQVRQERQASKRREKREASSSLIPVLNWTKLSCDLVWLYASHISFNSYNEDCEIFSPWGSLFGGFLLDSWVSKSGNLSTYADSNINNFQELYDP